MCNGFLVVVVEHHAHGFLLILVGATHVGVMVDQIGRPWNLWVNAIWNQN
jgi:hypothetical protein